MMMRIGKNRLIAGSLTAAGLLVTPAVAFACTLYQGTLKVCGDSALRTTCVTSTGGNDFHSFSVSGSTGAKQTTVAQTGHVTVQTTGLKSGATYNINFLDPVDKQSGNDCMTNVAQGGKGQVIATSLTGPSFTTGSLALPTDSLSAGSGDAAVCPAEQSPSPLGTGNEAPVTILAT